jgi:fibrillarin-like rRNA methylase
VQCYMLRLFLICKLHYFESYTGGGYVEGGNRYISYTNGSYLMYENWDSKMAAIIMAEVNNTTTL